MCGLLEISHDPLLPGTVGAFQAPVAAGQDLSSADSLPPTSSWAVGGHMVRGPQEWSPTMLRARAVGVADIRWQISQNRTETLQRQLASGLGVLGAPALKGQQGPWGPWEWAREVHGDQVESAPLSSLIPVGHCWASGIL